MCLQNHYALYMCFSTDVPQNLCDDIRKRIEREMDLNSVEVVSRCMDKRDYLTICELSAGSSTADIDISILHALRNGIKLCTPSSLCVLCMQNSSSVY